MVPEQLGQVFATATRKREMLRRSSAHAIPAVSAVDRQ